MGLPNLPGRRRAMPKPFQRPLVSISTPEGAKREWRETKVKDLAVGDIVATKGVVGAVEWLNQAGRIKLTLGDPPLDSVHLTDDTLLAFTRTR